MAQISIQLNSRSKNVLEYFWKLPAASPPPCWKLSMGLMVEEAVLKDESKDIAGTDKTQDVTR